LFPDIGSDPVPNGMSSDYYAFEISLHAAPARVLPGAGFTDLWGQWPTLVIPAVELSHPLSIDFDTALERLAGLDRLFCEPDGALLWTGKQPGAWWQVDGNVYDRGGRVLRVDLKGTCPITEFDMLLACFDWPEQRLVVQFVRAAVLVDEDTFRRHAVARMSLGKGRELRPAEPPLA
jgi:hypothetical protein